MGKTCVKVMAEPFKFVGQQEFSCMMLATQSHSITVCREWNVLSQQIANSPPPPSLAKYRSQPESGLSSDFQTLIQKCALPNKKAFLVLRAEGVIVQISITPFQKYWMLVL